MCYFFYLLSIPLLCWLFLLSCFVFWSVSSIYHYSSIRCIHYPSLVQLKLTPFISLCTILLCFPAAPFPSSHLSFTSFYFFSPFPSVAVNPIFFPPLAPSNRTSSPLKQSHFTSTLTALSYFSSPHVPVNRML